MTNYLSDFGFIMIENASSNLKEFSIEMLRLKATKSKYDSVALSEISDIKDEDDFNEYKEIFLYELNELFHEENFIASYLPYLHSSEKISNFFFLRPYFKFTSEEIKTLGSESFIKKIYRYEHVLSCDNQAIFIDDFYEIRESYILKNEKNDAFIDELSILKRDNMKMEFNSPNILVITES